MKLQIIKAVLLALIVAFLAANVIQPSDSDLKMNTVESVTLESIDLEQMPKQDNQSIKRFLGIQPEEYESVVYYKSADTMQASEIVLVKLKDHSQQAVFQQAMETHRDQQKNIFEGYAPEQAQLLSESLITIHANYAAFIVNKDATKINNQFLSNF